VLRKIHHPIFVATRFLARPLGPNRSNFTMPENHNAEDVIQVTFEDLDDKQKKLVEENRDTFTMESSSKTRGKVIQKNQLPTPSITVTSTTDGSAESSSVRNFQETVNTAVHHALLNQSRVLVNTLANLIQQVAGGRLEQQLGPTYFLVCSSAADKGKNPKEETTLLKMPPPIPTPQQLVSGLPYTAPHPMSGYPRQPPPPPPENPTLVTHGAMTSRSRCHTDKGIGNISFNQSVVQGRVKDPRQHAVLCSRRP
jgi:hypothetical protein